MSATAARFTRASLLARVLLPALLPLAAITCRDLPTQPLTAPDDPAAAAASSGLTVTPALDTLLIGERAALTTTNANGSPITKTATWTSSDTSVAVVTSTGLATAQVTARRAGAATITAAAQSKSGTARIVVLPVPVRSVSVTPDSASVQRGDSVQYAAVPRDSAGNALAGRAIVWSTADTTIARASATGKVTTLARGATQVRALVDGVSGTATVRVRVPQLTVSSLATVDSANLGDTVRVAYAVQNLWDTPDADSVQLRIGLRDGTGAVVAAQRRGLTRITAGETRADTVRLAVGSALAAGGYSVVVYVDCADGSGSFMETARLASCLATPATAGRIAEGDETDNSRTIALGVRGPDLTATSLTSPDTAFTRTSLAASIAIDNGGSATPTGFEVLLGLFDATDAAFVAASATTTPALASRASRAVSASVAIPAGLNAAHAYEVRGYVDCRGAGTTPMERIASCFATPATAGDVTEGLETNNSITRVVAVASNVARLDAQPDSVLLTSIGDSVALTATAYDRANAAVSGVVVSWRSLDSAVAATSGSVVRALATGSTRVIATADGRADTVRVSVVQRVASVVVTPDTSVVSVGGTVPLTYVARDGAGNVMTGTSGSWSSLDASLAAVSSVGVATAVSSGVARLVVTVDTRADTVVMIVNPAGTTLRWIGAVSAAWGNAANWYPHATPDSSSSVFVPAGTPNDPDLLGASVEVGSITIGAGASVKGGAGARVTAYHNVDVAGLAGFGEIVMAGTGSLRGDLPTLIIGASGRPAVTTLVGPTRAGSVDLGALGATGRLVVNGQTLVTNLLTVSAAGALVSTNPADSVIVNLDAVWVGTSTSPASVLSSGVLAIGNRLYVSAPDGMMAPTGTHTVLFKGPGTHDIATTDTLGAFNNVVFEGASTFERSTGIRGRMVLAPNAQVSMQDDQGSSLRFSSALPEVEQGSYLVSLSLVSGAVTMTRDVRLPARLQVMWGGSLTLAGHTLDVDALGSGGGTITMNSAADTIIARSYANFYGRENFSAGTLILRGDIAIGGDTPITNTVWSVSGTHKTVFDGTRPQSFGMGDTASMHLMDVEVRNTAGLTITSTVNVGGLLRLAPGAVVYGDKTNRVKFFTRLPDVSAGTWNLASVVAGNVTATQNIALPLSLSIDDGGRLRLAGHTVDVEQLNSYRGTLVMDSPQDTLIVRSGASLYGRSDLSAGTLVLKGDVRISRMGGNASAFAGSSAHRTVFAGTGTQNVYMPDDGQSYFGSVQLDGPGVVMLNDSIDVHGRLLAFGSGTLRSQSGHRVTVRGGLNVGGLTLDGVWLDVDGGTLSQFDNVTFRSFGGGPALLRVRHPGTGSAFTMHNVVFDVPSGYGPSWIEASDTDPTTGALQLDVVSPQAASGPAATVVSNGASVDWRTE